ncbi:MAG: hypothetical protein WD646_11315 [Actinomycetota bacterium]
MRGRRLGPYRRTLAAAFLATVVTIAGLIAFPAAVRSATPSVPGSASSVAAIASVVPSVGGLEFGIRTGVAATQVQNSVASAQAHSVNLGLIETTLTAEDCTGMRPIQPGTLPQALYVDNRKGDANASSFEVPIAGTQLGGGREEVRATTEPRAHAIATGVTSELGPIVVGGGRSDSETTVIDGTTYEARARTESSVDIAGLVKLTGMHWEALHRVGAEHTTEGRFTLGVATLGDLPFDISQLQPLADVLNTVLAPTGISLVLPKVVIVKEPVESVRVTPLAIDLTKTPLGSQLLNPGLEASSEQKAELFDQITAVACQVGSALFVGDVGLSILSGNGSLNIEVGGVRATAGLSTGGNPFGTPPEIGPELNLPDGPAPSLPNQNPGGTTTTLPGQAIGTNGEPVSSGCESTHPFHWPPCSKGDAGLLGLLGLVGVAAMAGFDWQHQRRLRARAEINES